MAYTQKDVTSKIKKKNKDITLTDDLIDAIDESIQKIENDENKHVNMNEAKTDISEPVEKQESQEMDDIFTKEFKSSKANVTRKKKEPKNRSILLNILLSITVICSVIYFGYHIIYYSNDISTLIKSCILTLSTILFLCAGFTSRKNKGLFGIGSLLLLAYFVMNITITSNVYSTSSNKVQDFSGKTLVDVVKWGNKNQVKVTQEYEYSDMVPEYEIISQNVKTGTSVHDIDEIVVAVSEGPNPYKEIVVPSMLTWDSERVINYVLSNYLGNVIVEFVESDQVKDTVIEQSKSGNLRRNEELKLTFSYGDEGNSNEVSLIDFTNKTKFEIEFYMKQHKLNYNFVTDFSSKIKKGYGIKQSVKPGSIVAVNGDKIQVTISKGPKVEIPDLSGMSVTELTEWAIKNRLKLEFIDTYDDAIKRGKVISIDKEKGEVVEQGTLLKVTLSLGSLKMPKFKNIDEFYTWADKYGIKYEVRHEFSDSVEAGQIISFSYKTGEVIKNDEAIVVTVSDGVKVTVPNLKGLSKSEATKKLKDAGLNYNFVYKNSTSKKDTVLSQSISSGSEVSKGTTVTVTLSTGSSGSSSSGSSGNTGSGSNSGGNTGGGTTPTPPAPSCSNVMVYIYPELVVAYNPSLTCSKIQSAYSSLKFSCSYVCASSSGILINSPEIDAHTFSTCDTITLRISDSSRC